jgi:hypothetical protein
VAFFRLAEKLFDFEFEERRELFELFELFELLDSLIRLCTGLVVIRMSIANFSSATNASVREIYNRILT